MGIYFVPTFIAHIVSMTIVSQGGYSGFQVTGMIEWGQERSSSLDGGKNQNPQK